jgi:hypothetical protein
VWDNNFDPLDIINKLNENLNIVHNNTQHHEKQIQELRQTLVQQQEVLDALVTALNINNLHQEEMLKQFLGTLQKGIKQNG